MSTMDINNLSQNEILLLKSAEKYNEKNTNKIKIDTLNKSINISQLFYQTECFKIRFKIKSKYVI